MNLEHLRERAEALRLYGVLAHWPEVTAAEWLAPLVRWEEDERARRSLERRLAAARIGRFKPLADFDWEWPTRCDRGAVETLMELTFLHDAANGVPASPNDHLCGEIDAGKKQALIHGHTVRFTTAGELLGDLAALDSDAALRRRLRHYAAPDLLFELVSRRYEAKSTLVTTNKAFAEWSTVFPNAACVVSLVDRLVHHSEVIVIEGESYRLKEAKERSERRSRRRREKTS